jgi:hypothetical protein
MRPYPQHLGSALRTALILAGYAAPVIDGFTALGADTFPTTAHRVVARSLAHGLSPELAV